MIVESVIRLIFAVVFLIWYLSKKVNSIKTVGICNKISNDTRGCRGMFEYQIEGIKYYNAESSSHIGWLKEGKKYAIYVKKYNHEKFVSRKVLMELLFFTILGWISMLFAIIEALHIALR